MFSALIYALDKYLISPKINGLRTRFSSKIKTIFVELHNYTFFHSPEGVKKAYSRYVGRDKLKEKLKAILTNSETKSGAYLVTGFRGMGKTSLVRKAIAEIKGNYYYALSKHFRQFLFLALLYLLYSRVPILKEKYNLTILYSALVICFLAAFYLIRSDKNRPNLWKYYDEKYIINFAGWIWEMVKSFVRIFDAEIDYYKRSKFKTFLQDIITVTFLFLISIVIILRINKSNPTIQQFDLLQDLLIIFTVTFGYFLIIFINNNIQLELLSDPKKKRFKSYYMAFVRIFGNAIKRLDYGNKVPIEISLSQDDLKEIDILKLLSKNIYSDYKALRNRVLAPNRIIIPIIQLVAIYIVVSLLYYYNPVYSFVNDFRQHSGLINYFPSQTLLPYLVIDPLCEECDNQSEQFLNSLKNENQLTSKQIAFKNSLDTLSLNNINASKKSLPAFYNSKFTDRPISLSLNKSFWGMIFLVLLLTINKKKTVLRV